MTLKLYFFNLRPLVCVMPLHKHVKLVLKSVCLLFTTIHRYNAWQHDHVTCFVLVREHKLFSVFIHVYTVFGDWGWFEPVDLCSDLFKIAQKPDCSQNYSHGIIKTWLYREQVFWNEDLWSMTVWAWWLITVIHLTWLEVKSRLQIWSEALLGWLKLLPRFFSIGLQGLRIGSANYYPSRELFFLNQRPQTHVHFFPGIFNPIAIIQL